MLEIKSLHKKYPSGPVALRGVDLTVNEGDLISLIGPSGAGKSTLVRCINRLVEPSSGQILLNSTDICKLSSGALRKARKKIGMIFQEYALVERLSVMENVLSGRLGYVSFYASLTRKFPQADISEALRLLDRVGLSDYVDTRADQLSGGQRQRVGICRALLQQPDFLLIDEPTASLDPKTARQIMRLITELVQERNITAIINIHEVTLAEMFSKRVVGLKEGRIVYDESAGGLTNEALTLIYGEEDWESAKTGADGNLREEVV
ncbi:phosphonate ABC transporter ATP-binding protein [Alkalispirochaeta sphaeroplastigenens]|uniref:Phosphonate ABC transporter ATP-binding protein n=1 Tax=Alkalispirochaeta sphaeroplastigenens TaxID=1187066 RepID=A0A2S4JHN0_9SPIO|nr:phosphonate ABC transporter ATP-binding protein [Alkalispirochaeta sphaeroplastigenens]POQ98930.1 phosphonate ABC transporter ATP-binding protein [Alkalispirochaeta sphaeroplastigenens]